MALTDKQVLGKWNQTGNNILARSFDSGGTFWIVQQVEGPDDENDSFVLREPAMLDRSDVTLQAGIVASTTKALLVTPTWPSGNSGGPQGLGYKAIPTNFTIPAGYAQTYGTDGTYIYVKAKTTSKVKTEAAAAAAAAAAGETGFLKKYANYIIGAVVLAVIGVVAYFGFKKKKK